MRRYTVDVVFKTRRRNREGQRSERKVIIVDLSLGVMCLCPCTASESSS
jgi:hypothetical protein